jgi:hypothetical protein
VTGDAWNLVAAIFCTVGAVIVTVATLLSEPTAANVLAGIGAGIGTLGGIAWIVSAVIALRQQ